MATDRLAITVHGQLGTTELGTRRLRVSSFLNLQYDDDGLQLTGAHVSDRQGLRMTLIKLISSKFPEQYSDNKDHIDDLIKDDGDEESPATTPNVLVRQVGTDGTLYTIADEEDLVDAILLDADKAITFRLEIRGKLCEILSDTIPSDKDESRPKSGHVKHEEGEDDGKKWTGRGSSASTSSKESYTGSDGQDDFGKYEQEYDDYDRCDDGRGVIKNRRQTFNSNSYRNAKSIRYISRIMPTPGKTPKGIDDSLVPPPPSAGKMESIMTGIDSIIPTGYQDHPEVAKREIAKLMNDFKNKPVEELCQTKYLFKAEFLKTLVMRNGETSLEWYSRLQSHVGRFGYFVPPLSSIVENHPRGQFCTEEIIGTTAYGLLEKMSMDLAMLLSSGELFPNDNAVAQELQQRVTEHDGYASLHAMIIDEHPETADDEPALESPKYTKGDRLDHYLAQCKSYIDKLMMRTKQPATKHMFYLTYLGGLPDDIRGPVKAFCNGQMNAEHDKLNHLPICMQATHLTSTVQKVCKMESISLVKPRRFVPRRSGNNPYANRYQGTHAIEGDNLDQKIEAEVEDEALDIMESVHKLAGDAIKGGTTIDENGYCRHCKRKHQDAEGNPNYICGEIVNHFLASKYIQKNPQLQARLQEFDRPVNNRPRNRSQPQPSRRGPRDRVNAIGAEAGEGEQETDVTSEAGEGQEIQSLGRCYNVVEEDDDDLDDYSDDDTIDGIDVMNVMRIEEINDLEIGAKLSDGVTDEIVNNIMTSEINEGEMRVAALRASDKESELSTLINYQSDGENKVMPDFRSGEGDAHDLDRCFSIVGGGDDDSEDDDNDVSDDDGSFNNDPKGMGSKLKLSDRIVIVTPKIFDSKALSMVCDRVDSKRRNQTVATILNQDSQCTLWSSKVDYYLQRLEESTEKYRRQPDAILQNVEKNQQERKAKAIETEATASANKATQRVMEEHQTKIEWALAEGATKSNDDDSFKILGRGVTSQVTNEVTSRLDVTDLVETTETIGEEYVLKKSTDGALVIYTRRVKKPLFVIGDAVSYDTDALTGNGRIETIEDRVATVNGREFRVPVYGVRLAPGLNVTAHPSELGWNPKAQPAMMTPPKSSA